MDKHYVVLIERVLMDLNRVISVLLGVRNLYSLGRQFVMLTDRYKSCADLHGYCRRQDKASRLDTYHLRYTQIFVMRYNRILHPKIGRAHV